MKIVIESVDGARVVYMNIFCMQTMSDIGNLVRSSVSCRKMEKRSYRQLSFTLISKEKNIDTVDNIVYKIFLHLYFPMYINV